MKTKHCKFILLDTDKPTNLGLVIKEHRDNGPEKSDRVLHKVGELCEIFYQHVDLNYFKPQELLLISLDPEEKIKEGDIVYLGCNKIEKVIDITNKHNNIVCESATFLKNDVKKLITNQSHISPQDIKKAIEEYNTNGEFKDVYIEMEYGGGVEYYINKQLRRTKIGWTPTVVIEEYNKFYVKIVEEYDESEDMFSKHRGSVMFPEEVMAVGEDVMVEPLIYTQEELNPLFEECLNLIGNIDTPIGRRKYPEDVVIMVKNIKKWFDENKK